MSNRETPSRQQLIDWLEGRLSPEEAERVQQQVDHADVSLRADVDWLRAFLHSSTTIVLDEPPADLRLALRARYHEFVQRESEADQTNPQAVDEPNLLQRLVAVLTFDSGLEVGMAGARAREIDSTRQLIFSSSALDISLGILQRSEGLYIDGQILPRQTMALETFEARLQQADDVLAQSTVNADGIFSIEAVRPGLYQFVVSGEGISVQVEAIDLRA